MIRPKLIEQPEGALWVALGTVKLFAAYNPFRALGVPEDVSVYQNEPAISTYVPCERRKKKYSHGRIAHFLRAGWAQPPEVDWYWQGGHPTRIAITDGHHRFCAAILANDPELLVEYSGPVNRIQDFAP